MNLLYYRANPYSLSIGPCYYAGNSQGGKESLSTQFSSVIEGKYTDYQVDGLFSYDYKYAQFEGDRCAEDISQ